MARLILRIGTHKTGSSAIQTALREETRKLKREHIYALKLFKGARMMKTIGYVNDAIIRSGRKHFMAAMERHARQSDATLVMSYEGLSGFPHAGYENAGVIAEMLRAMTEGIDTTIVVYVRRQDTFIESMYTQAIHIGKHMEFPAYIERIKDKSFDWYELVSRHSEQFGRDKIVVQPYDKLYLPTRESLMHSFADIIGSTLLKQGDSRYGVNAGYSKQAAGIASSLNAHLKRDEAEKLRLILQTTKAKKPFESYAYFDAATRQALFERYADSNARLAREFVPNSEGILFTSPEQDEQRRQTQADTATVQAADSEQARAALEQISRGHWGLVISKGIRRALGGKGRF